jgi:hypothetical protein
MKTKKSLLAAVTLASALAVGACSDGTGIQGDVRVQVLLTDAPIDYVDSAMVDIGAVILVPAGGGTHIVLSQDGTNGPVNLLALQNATTAVLAEADIDEGDYSQLRLIVESASVTLKPGYQFNDGSTTKTLFVPSGAQTGIKLILKADDGGPLLISGDMVLVVDFDVSRSFVIQGNPLTPAGMNGMLFKPTLRVVVEDLAGKISGRVSTALAGTRVDSLTVTATPVDEGTLEQYQTQTATTMTDADGDYTLHFLVPGSYWVKVGVGAGLATQPDSTLVDVDPKEHVTGVDFAVVTGP